MESIVRRHGKGGPLGRMRPGRPPGRGGAPKNKFPACGTARLNDPTQGANTCPKGSQIGTGHFIAAVGPSTNSSISGTCRADVTVYNGGNHDLSYYVFKGPEKNACAVPNGHEAFDATLKKTAK